MSKLAVQEQTKSKLANLPNEMLDHVFKFLPLNDLASMNQTSKGMKNLTGSFFERMLRTGIVKANLNSNGKIERWHDEKYELVFGSFIEEIYLRTHTIEPRYLEKLFRLVKKRCTQHIRRLSLDFSLCNYEAQPNMPEFEIMAEQLDKLETFYMWCPPSISGLLEQCQNLQALFVAKRWEEQIPDEWTHTVLSELKVFIMLEFDILHSPQPLDLTQFLFNAPQLQAIGLNNTLAIRSFLRSNCSVNYAALWFRRATDLFGSMDDIERMCRENRIRSLYLGVFDFDHRIGLLGIFNRIQYLPNVKGFHFVTGLKSTEEIFSSGLIQSHLQSVCFNNARIMPDLNLIPNMFPNIQELHVHDLEWQNNNKIKEMIKSIACKNRFLKQIKVSTSTYKIVISDEDLIEINAARSKLANPAFLTIQATAYAANTKLENVLMIDSAIVECLQCRMYGTIGFPCFEEATAYLKSIASHTTLEF